MYSSNMSFSYLIKINISSIYHMENNVIAVIVLCVAIIGIIVYLAVTAGNSSNDSNGKRGPRGHPALHSHRAHEV